MPAPVQIEYVRSGGMAGLRKTASVDTRKLRDSDPSAADNFEQVASAVLAAPPPAGSRTQRADGFQHAISITQGAEKRSFTTWDPVTGASLEQLLKLLAPLTKLAD
jgi:hypothetical protein